MWNAMLVRTTVYSRMAKMVYTVVRTQEQGTVSLLPPTLPGPLGKSPHFCSGYKPPKTTAIMHTTENMTTSGSQPGLTSSLTIHVVPKVDSQRREEGDEVDDEKPLFPVVGLAVLEDGLSDHWVALWICVGSLPSWPQFLRAVSYLPGLWKGVRARAAAMIGMFLSLRS